MRVVFRMSAIVAALAVATSISLAGCGQRGPLHLPTVPPLPAKPGPQTPPSSDATRDAQTASDAAPNEPLTLRPADALGASGSASAGAAPNSNSK